MIFFLVLNQSSCQLQSVRQRAAVKPHVMLHAYTWSLQVSLILPAKVIHIKLIFDIRWGSGSINKHWFQRSARSIQAKKEKRWVYIHVHSTGLSREFMTASRLPKGVFILFFYYHFLYLNGFYWKAEKSFLRWFSSSVNNSRFTTVINSL